MDHKSDIYCTYMSILLFFHKTNKLPSWGEHLFSTRRVVVVEEAEVDPVARTMVTYTRNLNLRLV